MVSNSKNTSDQPTGFLLWKAGNAWQRQIKIALTPVKLTHVQYLILETLQQLAAERKPSSQAQIAKTAGIDVMMTSKVIRLLVQKKLVARRSPGNDARAFSAVLTSEGKTVLTKARALVVKSENAFFAGISKRKKFTKNLETLAQ